MKLYPGLSGGVQQRARREAELCVCVCPDALMNAILYALAASRCSDTCLNC